MKAYTKILHFKAICILLFVCLFCISEKANSKNNDAGIATIISPNPTNCSSGKDITVLLKNYGTNDLNSVIINWSYNGVVQVPIAYTTKLKSDSSVAVTLAAVKYTGVYNIKVWTYKPNGGVDSVAQNDTAWSISTVNQAPVAKFSVADSVICGAPFTETCTFLSTNANVQNWDFGDSKTSTAINPVHTYLNGGSYKIKLVVVNSNGCKDSTYKTVFANANCSKYNNDAGITNIISPNVTACTNVKGITVLLKNYGNKDLNAVNIGWSLNSIIQTSYRYTKKLKSDSSVAVTIYNNSFSAGKYTIKVWTYAPNGGIDSVPLNDTAILVLAVSQSPVAKFSVSDSVLCNTPYYEICTFLSTGAAVVRWDFGDLNSSTMTSPVHRYLNVGTYKIMLLVENPYGCMDSTFKTIIVNTNCSSIYQNDAGIAKIISPNPTSCTNGNDITVQLKNYGKGYLNSVNIGWSVDGVVQTPYLYASKLKSDSTVAITLGIFNFSSGKYNIKAWTYLPNGGSDSFSQNDTSVSISTVNQSPTAKFTITNQMFCIANALAVNNLSTNTTTYYWDLGDSTTSLSANPAHTYKHGGSFTIKLIATSSNGCKDSALSAVYVDPDCVWPGDANYDKTANIFDVLPIGLAYNETGYARPDSSTTWAAHACEDWTKSFVSGANHKHADCDGDGLVDSKDLKAIVRNYGKKHLKSGAYPNGNVTDPDLYLIVSKDSITVKDTLTVQMNLGTSAKPVTNIYGVCFSVTYDPLNVSPAKGIIADLSNCWLGTVGTNLIYLVQNDSTNGVLDVGITRTDHKSVTGYGPLGTLTIIMPDDVGGKKEVKKELQFNIQNVKAIQANETDVPLYTVPDSTLLYQWKTGIEPILLNSNTIKIFPNPANSILHLDAGELFISDLNVVNVLGQNVLNQKSNLVHQSDINISNLVPGLYFIDINTDKGMVRTRFVKE